MAAVSSSPKARKGCGGKEASLKEEKENEWWRGRRRDEGRRTIPSCYRLVDTSTPTRRRRRAEAEERREPRGDARFKVVTKSREKRLLGHTEEEAARYEALEVRDSAHKSADRSQTI
jgi:hypothetical protein